MVSCGRSYEEYKEEVRDVWFVGSLGGFVREGSVFFRVFFGGVYFINIFVRFIDIYVVFVTS